jgi:hypothetical protein
VVSALFLVFVALGYTWDGVPVSRLFEGENLLLLLSGVLVVIVMIAVIDFVFLHGLYRLVFRRFALANRELTVTLQNDCIKWASAGFGGECAWRNVKWLIETKDRLFLFISKVEAIVCPREPLRRIRNFAT